MKKIIACLISLAIIITFLLSSTDFMATNSFYYHTFHSKNNIAVEAELSEEWVYNASESLVEFIKKGNTNILEKYFNQKEVTHMEDVYSIFKITRIVYIALLITIIVSFLYAYYFKDFDLISIVKSSLIKIYFIFIMFLSVLVFFFTTSFVYFHKIFFTNDLWLLDYETDLMIRILPEKFFMIMTIFIIVLTSVLVLISYYLLRKFILKISRSKNYEC